MSIARFHAEWLSLLDISGPFLSLPVLVRRFPQGLEGHDADHFRLLRQVFEEWDDNQQSPKPDPGIHTQWIKWVLKNTLELDEVLLEGQDVPQTLKAEIEEPQNRETLRPDLVLMDPDGKNARLLIQVYPLSQRLVRVVEGKRWKASPDTRMTQLLRDTGVPLGLVTNGDQWMLVYAPKGETSGYTSWYSNIWLDEHKTLEAFRTLLGLHRFFGVPDDETLESMLAESAEDQQEVTDQLGYQVRRAVEVLVQSLDKADQDYGGKLLKGVPETVLYEASLTIMMRLVFLFCAEERELLLLGDELYDDNYAVSTLREQLRATADNHGEEILERRHDAWNRLLTTFRAVFSGVQHERMKLPPYGGSLFNPDRFPFLEGREPKTKWRDTPSQPLPINNRTVLHLLEALQVLQVRLPGGGPTEPRKLSFRSLGIEQIGHVYEGLLDHTAIRATEPVLGLAGTRDKEPEIALSKLEELAANDEKELHKFLMKETGRSSVATIKRMLDADLDDQAVNRFRTACHGNDDLWNRIKPFAGLVRTDTFGYPAVIVSGSVYVTAGTDRRSSGTHYTPKSLTEPIVQYTLELLVYEGPAEGKPKSEWGLKSAAELLDLKICDMACGSGAFLVQACRYMSERLVEAWQAVEKQIGGTARITPLGEVSEGGPTEQIIPADSEERLAYARRIIAQRCLYGVDVNPFAAEMAKLSLWLLTLAKDKPFEFLDHAIRCGDSLIGIHDIEQLKHFSLKPDNSDTPLFKGPLDEAVNESIKLRLKLEDMPSNTVEDVEAQEKLLKEADDKIARLRCAADLLVAAEFWGENAKDKQEKLQSASAIAANYFEKGPTEEFKERAKKERRGQKTFHWPLEFPEAILNRGGFDGFVGNPPFMGGRNITSVEGKRYNDSLQEGFMSPGTSADLCSYFLKQGWRLLPSHGAAGFVTVETIATGKTLLNGLASIDADGGIIFRARTVVPWPGDHNRKVAIVHFAKEYRGSSILNEAEVSGITPSLRSASTFDWNPRRLARNFDIGFQGITVNGEGFIISPSKASEVCQHDSTYESVLTPYLTGLDLNRLVTPRSTQFVINFHGMSESQAADHPLLYKHLSDTIREMRVGITSRKDVQEKWWSLQRVAPELEKATADKERVLARTRYGANHAVTFVAPNCLFSDGVLIFARSAYRHFAVLQSTIHFVWALTFGSPRAGGLRYKLKPCFEAFPFPEPMSESLESIGDKYFQDRQLEMQEREEGINELYNLFHDPDDTSEGIQKLRELHVEMDQAVGTAYGWGHLDLGHGFHETKLGLRYTISEPARREVLQRLLKLNHERYEEEVKQGLHDKKKKRTKKKATARKRTTKKKVPAGPNLFGDDDDEGG